MPSPTVHNPESTLSVPCLYRLPPSHADAYDLALLMKKNGLTSGTAPFSFLIFFTVKPKSRRSVLGKTCCLFPKKKNKKQKRRQVVEDFFQLSSEKL
jgi:hypothetical protein